MPNTWRRNGRDLTLEQLNALKKEEKPEEPVVEQEVVEAPVAEDSTNGSETPAEKPETIVEKIVKVAKKRGRPAKNAK